LVLEKKKVNESGLGDGLVAKL